MRVAIFLGAGASKGSQGNAPPLGSEVFSKINKKVQDHRVKIVRSDGMQAFGHYKREDIEIQDGVELGQWIFDAHPDASRAFETDFEAGMALLKDIKPVPYYSGAALLPATREIITPFMDWTLSERVMANVAAHLFQYSPSQDSLYFQLLDALPEGASIFTLNYDTLIEETASAACINLLEPAFVHTSLLTRPKKNLHYFQLHGGCTLLEGFSPPIPTMLQGMVVNTDQVHRLRKSPVVIDKDLDGRDHSVRMTIGNAEYEELFARRAQLSFFRDDKFSPLGGAYPKACFESYHKVLADASYAVFFCGCRFHPVDKHIWEPVSSANAKVYWCGDESAMDNLPGGSEFIENRLSEKTVNTIRGFL